MACRWKNCSPPMPSGARMIETGSAPDMVDEPDADCFVVTGKVQLGDGNAVARIRPELALSGLEMSTPITSTLPPVRAGCFPAGHALFRIGNLGVFGRCRRFGLDVLPGHVLAQSLERCLADEPSSVSPQTRSLPTSSGLTQTIPSLVLGAPMPGEGRLGCREFTEFRHQRCDDLFAVTGTHRPNRRSVRRRGLPHQQRT